MKQFIAANDNNFGFYVYLWRQANGQPFYVGKGKGKRAYDVYDRSDEFKTVHANGGCAVEIVDWFIHESQALAYEVELIELYGRRDLGGVLVNKTDGGDGCVGHIKSAETIEKWRAKNVGRKRSADVGRRISEAKMGHSVSDETRAKLSEALKKRFTDPAERAKVSERMANISDLTRQRMSEAQKRRMEDPAVRKMLSEISSGKPRSEEVRRRISATTTGVPKPDSTVASMRLAQRMKGPRGIYKGVSADGSKWRAMISIDGHSKRLGMFDTPEQAAVAYDDAALAAWGVGGCYLNFPAAANDNNPAEAGSYAA
ncbi:hypothetical protein IB276_26170 [Ensifer sp. ENS04]|uniref:NUMOD3 domain-containing DNA-binding protein n=1 Tax=Ensifer sp. ENS04 TaxID=2769281 RepID=UPI00177E8ABD|nr:NUMOD3 domain-containing DNA-binding protein [Ensifer sp. ENS04]MBD9542936.1 hypothetical protein [Ensifer sp. ENS04]